VKASAGRMKVPWSHHHLQQIVVQSHEYAGIKQKGQRPLEKTTRSLDIYLDATIYEPKSNFSLGRENNHVTHPDI
jgi:hypothetical protein